jgi:xylulose-5-phosphate/fructose-6-phosphate phosphoketolase
MACCSDDVPTLETLAAVSILRERLHDLRICVVSVVGLMKLEWKGLPRSISDNPLPGE